MGTRPTPKGTGGLPETPVEVFMFSVARSSAGAPDFRALVFAWIVLVGLGVAAVVARSLVSGALCVALALVTIPWTTGKVRSRALVRRLEHHAD